MLRSEHGLVKVGSCSDPIAAIARIRKRSPYRLTIEYLGYMRADKSVKVAQAVQAALDRHSHQPGWYACAQQEVLAAIETAVRRYRQVAIPIDIEGFEHGALTPDSLGKALRWWSHRKEAAIGLACLFIGLLAAIVGPSLPNFHPAALIGPCMLLGLMLAFAARRA